MSDTRKIPQGTKSILEMGPVLLFILVISFGKRFGLEDSAQRFVVATALLVPLAIAALIYIWTVERKTPWMLLVSTLFLTGFGLLTIVTGDPKWVKIKVSIINAAFALVLLASVLFSWPILKSVLGQTFDASHAQWRRATLIMAVGFTVSAIANEFMWRNLSDVAWGWGAKVGLVVFSLIFTFIAMAPIISEAVAKENAKASEDSSA